MKIINKIVKIFKNRWFIFLATGFFVIAFFLGIFIFIFNVYYSNKFLPRVMVDNIILSGKTFDEGLQSLERATNSFTNDGIFFKYKDKEVVVSPIISSTGDPDLSQEVFSFNLDKAIKEAYNIGRNNNKLNFWRTSLTLLEGKNINLFYNLNEKELKDILISNFSSLENSGKNATVNIKYKFGKYKIEIEPEKLGKSFDYDLAISDAKNNLSVLSIAPIEMYMKTDYPTIKTEGVKKIIPKIVKVLKLTPINLIFSCHQINEKNNKFCENKKTIKVKLRDFVKWIKVGKNKRTNKIVVVLDKKVISDFLKKIAQKINRPAQDAKFKIENNKVSEFQQSKDGIVLDIKNSLANIEKGILTKNTSTVKIIIKKELAKNKIIDINNLGISELIGVGVSNFTGSPKNRKHNITVGAEKLNGLLIKPGETFSLVSALGNIDKDNGYLQELVIKGNKTIPEYGGGLCQIATTVFRLALNTGLPITERRSHAYRVSYYEPAGTDATIYIPKPDLKFINDTKKYLLLQTEIDDDSLVFKFWGTSDGRKTEISQPEIYNIVQPGPTKIIETEDLKPGEKKCTEHSHNGVSAKFIRKIIYSNGKNKEETWFSKYKPWRAVCLVGKEIDSNQDINSLESKATNSVK